MFNQYALEKKSYYNSSQSSNGFYTFYDNITGSLIGDIRKLSFADEIRKSVSVQTVVSNQLGLINSAELQMLKKDKDKTDQQTTYQPALDFLDRLNNPNSSPSPKHWNGILQGVYKSYLSRGIVALILKGAKTKKIKNIEIASNVSYSDLGGIATYNIQTKKGNFRQQLIFQEEEIDGNTFFTNGDDIAIIFGNFDDEALVYQSPLTPLQDVILWGNHIISSSRAFYENSCRPSSIITVKFLDSEGGTVVNKGQNEDIGKIIAEIKTQIKGTNNTGKVIIPNAPNLDIKVTPLSITQNAVDIEKQLTLTEKMIYSLFAGVNTGIIKGESEYAGNKDIALAEYYDSTVAYFTNIILDELNAFLSKWLQYVGGGNALQRQGIYLNFNIDGIKRYNNAKVAEAIELAKVQLIKKEEARTAIRKYKEDFADLEILSPEEDGFINEKQSNNA